MSHDEHTPFRENIPAYAIGALDAESMTALDAHLRICSSCQIELDKYQPITMGLLQSTPPRMPSPALRQKLASRLPSHQKPTRSLLIEFFSQFSLRQVATVTFIAILLASNLYSTIQIRDLKLQQTALAERLRSEQAAIAMLAYPGTQALTVNADVQNLMGSMLVDKSQNTAVLLLWQLPQLKSNQTYQAWLIDANGKRISGGLFTALADQGYTLVVIKSPVPMNNFIRVGVTVEPQGGSAGPTGPRVLIVNL